LPPPFAPELRQLTPVDIVVTVPAVSLFFGINSKPCL
jgi:hypothetical protein